MSSADFNEKYHNGRQSRLHDGRGPDATGSRATKRSGACRRRSVRRRSLHARTHLGRIRLASEAAGYCYPSAMTSMTADRIVDTRVRNDECRRNVAARRAQCKFRLRRCCRSRRSDTPLRTFSRSTTSFATAKLSRCPHVLRFGIVRLMSTTTALWRLSEQEGADLLHPGMPRQARPIASGISRTSEVVWPSAMGPHRGPAAEAAEKRHEHDAAAHQQHHQRNRVGQPAVRNLSCLGMIGPGRCQTQHASQRGDAELTRTRSTSPLTARTTTGSATSRCAGHQRPPDLGRHHDLRVTLFLGLVRAVLRAAEGPLSVTHCGLQRHDQDAVHCKACGQLLNIPNE